MDAVAERDVPVGVVTGDVEAQRVVEHRRVEVAGQVGQVQPVALGDLDAGDLGVDLRGPHEVPDRCRPADHLVDGVGQQVGVALEEPELVGVLGQARGARRPSPRRWCRGRRWR